LFWEEQLLWAFGIPHIPFFPPKYHFMAHSQYNFVLQQKRFVKANLRSSASLTLFFIHCSWRFTLYSSWSVFFSYLGIHVFQLHVKHKER